MIDFRLDPDQLLVRDTARELLATSSSPAADSAPAADDALWRSVSDLGWPGLVVSEEYGGSGLSLIELAVVAEELGAAVSALPVLSTALAGLTVELAGDLEQRARLLPELTAGALPATIAPDEELEPGSGEYSVEGTEDGPLLSGVRFLVPDAWAAKLLVGSFTETTNGGSRKLPVALRLGEGGVTTTPRSSFDVTRPLCDLRFDRVSLAGAVLVDTAAYARCQDAAIAVAMAELVGVGRRVLEMAVEYAGKRRQFGRPIGSFQSLKQLCSEMKVLCENSWSAAYNAVWACEVGDPSARRAVSLAKTYCGPATVRICETGVQVFGGMAYAAETGIHLYLKRALSTAARFGSTELHRRRILDELAVA